MRDRAEGSVMRGPGSTIRANEWNAERGNTQTSPPPPIGARGAANVSTSPVSLINLIEAASQSVAPSCDGPRIILAGERSKEGWVSAEFLTFEFDNHLSMPRRNLSRELSMAGVDLAP